MRYRKLSSSGDYTFGNGQNDFYRDVPAAVGQAAQTRLLLWLGEWFLDTEEGTYYFQGILGKKTKEQADTTIQDRVLGTLNIVDITEYESVIDPDTRALSIEMKINTAFGPTLLQIENFLNY